MFKPAEPESTVAPQPLRRETARGKEKHDLLITQVALLALLRDVTDTADNASNDATVNQVQRRFEQLKQRVTATTKLLLALTGDSSEAAISVKTRGFDSSTDSNGEDYSPDLPDLYKDPPPANWIRGQRQRVRARTPPSGVSIPVFNKTDKEIEAISSILNGSFVFEGLLDYPKLVRSLILALKPVVVPEGAEIIRQGDTGDGMYFVQEGKVELRRSLGEEEMAIFDVDGNYFGEVAVLHPSKRSYSAYAMSQCKLLYLDAAVYGELMARRFKE